MLIDLKLMMIQTRALFTHDAGSRLLFINEPDDGHTCSPLIFGSDARRKHSGSRADLPAEPRRELETLCAKKPVLPPVSETELLNTTAHQPLFFAEYIKLLEQHAPVNEIDGGPAYRFPKSKHMTPPISRLPVVIMTERNPEVLSAALKNCSMNFPAGSRLWRSSSKTTLSRSVAACASLLMRTKRASKRYRNFEEKVMPVKLFWSGRGRYRQPAQFRSTVPHGRTARRRRSRKNWI